MPDGDDVGVVCEHFEGHRVDQIAVDVSSCLLGGVGIAREVELDEIPGRQRLAVHRVRVMLFQPGADHLDVEYRAVRRAHGILEGLEARGAKVEGQPPKLAPLALDRAPVLAVKASADDHSECVM